MTLRIRERCKFKKKLLSMEFYGMFIQHKVFSIMLRQGCEGCTSETVVNGFIKLLPSVAWVHTFGVLMPKSS